MTVLARRIVAEPVRTASETWEVIVSLLASESDNGARKELLAIAGIASSLIAAEAMKGDPIVVYGSGPRVRIYCLYGEEAIVGDDANESKLISNPVAGDWSMSLPCPEDDLTWVQSALKKQSAHVGARTIGSSTDDDNEVVTSKGSASINLEAFSRT